MDLLMLSFPREFYLEVSPVLYVELDSTILATVVRLGTTLSCRVRLSLRYARTCSYFLFMMS
jgi:hypothetical protein